jgi:thiol:disulfide interchange protein DsbG
MKHTLLVSVSLLMLCVGLCKAGAWVNTSAESLQRLTQRLEQAKWIAAGSKSPTRVVYIFTDPNCPYCNDLWQAMQSARAPDVQVRYLLVAVINDESRGKDAAILESKDPLASFEKNERTFASGGIVAKRTWQPATNEAIARDEALMAELRILGTPGLVYWDEQHKPRIFAGMPDSEQLRMMVGRH